MSRGKIKQRNETVDILRGVAMMMVVLGHTMTGCTENSEASVLFNIIWSLQMPLFILISGYVTKYSKSVSSIKELYSTISRRSLAYLLPWFIWTVVIRGLIIPGNTYFDIRQVLWHMDSGYWFLFTIWTICLIFSISQFVAFKITKKDSLIANTLVTLCVYVLGMIILAIFGMVFGISFLGIKLTLYYMPFYFLGVIYARYEDVLMNYKLGECLRDVTIAISCVVYLIIISRFNLYLGSDELIHILIRVMASICGCIIVSGLHPFENVKETRLGKSIKWIGVHSLEIYLVHGFVLSLIKLEDNPIFVSPSGIGITFINYILTIALSCVIITLLNKNKLLRIVLFGKIYNK